MNRATYRMVVLSLLLVFLSVFLCALPYSVPARERQERAPDFELEDIHGIRQRLADYRGKVVVVNFWATWCPECVEEMPSLNALYEKYRSRGLVVLGISADKKKESVLRVVKRTGVTYPVMMDTKGGVLIKRYTVIAMPTTVIIRRDGILSDKVLGKTDFVSASFTQKIEALLGLSAER